MVSLTYTDDDNHVILSPLEGHEDCQGDYINASYVDVSHLFHELHYHCIRRDGGYRKVVGNVDIRVVLS